MRLLLEKGADINAELGRVGGTALDEASRRGHKPVVRLMWEKGARRSTS